MGKAIIRLLREAVRSHRDLLYIKKRRAESRIGATFQEVDHQARRVAGFLLSRGLVTGDCAALLSKGRNSWVITELGVLMAGSIIFAFPPGAFREENGTTNSSLKMVRRRIVERYKQRCDQEEDPLSSSKREVLRSCLARESV
jgi:acyl-CoA synthetase (AMP-forming)/AMP-acid ligase II